MKYLQEPQHNRIPLFSTKRQCYCESWNTRLSMLKSSHFYPHESIKYKSTLIRVNFSRHKKFNAIEL